MKVILNYIAAFVCPATLVAQTGLLVVAHGAGPEWNGPVRETVASVSWPHGPVQVAFLMGAETPASGWDSAAAPGSPPSSWRCPWSWPCRRLWPRAMAC